MTPAMSVSGRSRTVDPVVIGGIGAAIGTVAKTGLDYLRGSRQDAIAALNVRMEQMGREITAQNIQIGALWHEKADMLLAMAALKEQLVEAKIALANAEEDRERLRQTVVALTEEVVELRRQLSAHRRDCEELVA